MADSSNNQTNNAASDSNQTKKPVALSPWDDDVPEEKAKPKTPTIVGTLEPKSGDKAEEKPVPFNIPKDVEEEKVGKKVPAGQFIPKTNTTQANEPAIAPKVIPKTTLSNDSPAKPTPENISAPKPIVDPSGKPIDGVNNQPSPIPKPVPIDSGNSEINPKNIAPKTELPRNQVPINNINPPKTPETSSSQDFFARKRDEVPKINTAPVSQPSASNTNPSLPSNQAPRPTIPQNQMPPVRNQGGQITPPKAPANAPRPPKKFPLWLGVTAIILFLFATSVFLTEAGFISIGVEKVYGLVGLEKLWGGLPRNPETALGMSIIKMKDHPNFKFSGTITMTVDKTNKSPITLPLVSINIPSNILTDENVGFHEKATLTQSDTSSSYQDYYGSSTDSTNSTGTSTSTTDNSTTQSLGDQKQYSSYDASLSSTVKEIKSGFDGLSSQDAVEANFKIKKIIGVEDVVSIIANKQDLYVKTSSNIKFDPKADPNKWLDYKFNSLKEDYVLNNFYNFKADNGFSIIGRRVGNEKAGGVRCYKYQIDSIEIGDSLTDIGISKDMIQKMEGFVWIGVSDHLIHKISFTIIPSVASAVSRIDIEAEFSEFDIENDITLPSLSDKIDIGGGATTATPNVNDATSNSSNQSQGGDSQRKADLAKIKEALTKYQVAKGSYPVSTSWIKINGTSDLLSKALLSDYISAMPNDPKSADGWYYGYKSDGKNYTISARLENTSDPQVTKVGDIYLHYVYNK